MGVSIDIDRLARQYFYWDEPIEYKLEKSGSVTIQPIMLRQAELFLSSCDILNIDKNSAPDIEIIKMPYLEFLVNRVIPYDAVMRKKFCNIMSFCLNWERVEFRVDSENHIVLAHPSDESVMSWRDFDMVSKIILYQNIPHYDDSYMDPDLKEDIEATNQLRHKNIVPPSLERRIAIITAHTGVTKKEQLEMSYRSHQLLFEEVCGEVDFTTTRPVALFASKSGDIDHWIYRKQKDKLDGYITSVDKYNKSMGGNGQVQTTYTDE